MRRLLFPVVIALVTTLFFFLNPFQDNSGDEVYAEKNGELLLPERNVAIVALELESAGLSFTNPEDIIGLRELQTDLMHIPGAVKVESILNGFRVISREDDIIVSKAIPANNGGISEEYLQTLAEELQDFPELTPYVNKDLDTLLFYVYFGNRAKSIDIYRGLGDIKSKWADTYPIEFTGKAPILAETEILLTNDIVLFFPVLAVMVVLVFSLFRNLKAILFSLGLILISVAVAYAFVRFIGLPNSPLILLIPVFSLGLLSDYLIHFFYHHFYTPAGGRRLRRLLLFPLSLTALSTLTGFLSLSVINGSGHLQLGIIIAVAVVVTWFGIFYWLDFYSFVPQERNLLSGFRRLQSRFFGYIARYRYVFFVIVAAGMLWGGANLSRLSIEPYPIQQLPDEMTIKKADVIINREFYGTLPFFIEIDTGVQNGIHQKDTLLRLQDIHTRMEKGNVGYAFSLLTVIKRINYYFMGSEDSFLTGNEFDDFFGALIEQYLLYYSSSVDPLEYESLMDNSARYLSVKGLLHYRDYRDLNAFVDLMDSIRRELPENWSLGVHGMVAQLETEQNNLRNNWLLSFLGGSFLIFITVLIFYRKLGLALLSLVPGVISMVMSFGFIAMAGISIDAFSIIFVAIITGLVIDYSIHTLVALDQLKEIKALEDAFSVIMGYSGIPIFLSFMTSLLSFSILFFSSFSGARNLGFLLLTSLVLSFFLSLYLIPLIILPMRLKTEKSNA